MNSDVQAIIDRASDDPEFLANLRADPVETLRAEGYVTSEDEVRSMLTMENASDHELAEALHARVSKCG